MIQQSDAGRGLLRRFYRYESGIPTLDPELFKACFQAWVSGLRDSDADIIAIDGKTSRRSHDRRKGRNPLHLVSAWARSPRRAGHREHSHACWPVCLYAYPAWVGR